MSRRKVAVVTGTRADYGLIRWLLSEIQDEPTLELQLVVTGMHLSPEFGLTFREIVADGFPIDAKVEMLLSADTPSAIAKSMGLATIGFADAFARLHPDLLVLVGDRFETLAAAQAALVARIPIAHIHGGEVTVGAFDDAIRHAITKMSGLHFVAAELFRRRVIQLGEAPERVYTVGAPGLDNIRRLALLDRPELEAELGFSLAGTCFLVCYHPATLGDRPPEVAMGELLRALDAFPSARLVITYPNADTAGRVLIDLIEAYAADNPGRVLLRASLGQLRYLSVMRLVDAVIGNSSSGIIEAASFQKPTVNIGSRQEGRLRPESVIDCDERAEEIVTAIERALSAPFQERLAPLVNPYGDGDASRRIVREIARAELRGLVVKSFYDLNPPDALGIPARAVIGRREAP